MAEPLTESQMIDARPCRPSKRPRGPAKAIRRGLIVMSAWLPCATCNHEDHLVDRVQLAGGGRPGPAHEAYARGWRYDQQRGWRCPKCRGVT